MKLPNAQKLLYVLLTLCVACSFEETTLIGEQGNDPDDDNLNNIVDDDNTEPTIRACNFAWAPETFDDGNALLKWLTGGNEEEGFVATVENGALALHLGEFDRWQQSTLQSNVNGFVTDFSGKETMVKILEVPKTAASSQSHLSLSNSFNDGYFSIVLNATTLRFIYREPGTSIWHTLGSVIYDPDVHVHWRLRHEQDTLFAEYSTDLRSFLEIGSTMIQEEQSPMIENSFIVLRAVSTALVEQPGRFVVDDLNIDSNCE